MRKIKIEMRENNTGNLEIDPVNKRLLRKCKRRIVENHREGSPEMHTGWQKEKTESWLNRGSCVYVQGDWLCDEIYNELRMPGYERGYLRQDYTVVKLVSIDVFDHWFCHYNQLPDEYFLS